MLMFYCCKSSESPKSPAKKQAVIRITVSSTPILMEWSYYAQLWYARPIVTVAETNGVGVSVTKAKTEFIYKGASGYEVQDTAGGRLNAGSSQTYYLEIGTKYYGYEKMRFTVIGTDDNGHGVNAYKDFDLHYVEW